ncbi:LysR family transcriptional regulator [Granulosicoccaceae sp. 1_MG-2023]|nr:LysR family transcriptional regulator [Granulosicoccaceae sp. 1_MG-2023]
MNYDLTDLKLFVAVAEAGSLSRGAARVHLAVSSASHRISRLEADIGAPLLHRLPRGVALTRAGELMLGGARDVLARLEQLHADLLPHASGIVGQVSLWANTNAINIFLPQDLPGFLSRHPQLRVSLREAASPDIVRAVSGGEAEIGVFAGEMDTGTLCVLPYRQDRLVLIAPPGADEAGQGPLAFRHVVKRPFVTLASGTGIHTFLMSKAAECGATLDVRIQVQSFQAVLNMVAAGVGYGLVPASSVGAAMPVAVIGLKDAWSERQVRLCYRADVPLSKHAAGLLEWLGRAGRQHRNTSA